MKYLIFLLYFIFLIESVYANGISISPSQINFNATQNQMSCEQITIQADKQSILIGEDRWAEKGITEKKFSLHKLSAEELNLEINYSTNFETTGISDIEVCITAKDSGLYHGLLLYKTSASKAGVGIWLTANISKKENILINKITGNSINLKNNSVFVLSMATLFSAIILILLMLKLNRKKKLVLQ